VTAAAPAATSAGDWWKTAVVYQIYPRSFADSNGDGIGDIPGIISHLDHIAALGVDVVWLSPVYRSPMDDNGYDISDYYDIDPIFGSLADLDELTAGLHRLGIKMIMDLVVNHTSDEHPWFVESGSSRDNPKRDWYWWRDQPNNWGSHFSGSAWDHDPTTGQWYLHLFSPKQPDLNWENPAVRAAIHEMMRWWLDRGIDGFRVDVATMMSKDPALPDGPVAPGALHGDASPHAINGPRIHEFFREMHDEVYARYDRPLLVVGEIPGSTLADALLYTDPDRHEMAMGFQFEHMHVDAGASKWDVRPFELVRLKQSLGRWQEGLAQRGWNSLYWDNHDQPRVVSRWGDDGEHRVRSAKLLATILHLHRGTPYVYQGEELGMTNLPPGTPLEDLRDVDTLRFHAEQLARGADSDKVMAAIRYIGRDNARTPMQWDASEHGGFTTGEPWLMANPNHTEINAADQRDDPDSVFAHYRRLIALRHELPVIVHGDFTMLVPDDPQRYAFTRALGTTTLLVIGNWSGEATTVAGIAVPAGAELLLTNVAESTDTDLQPWECRVYLSPG
jgi:oligo-1,6-glucosidase